jgi:hypothetical protein
MKTLSQFRDFFWVNFWSGNQEVYKTVEAFKLAFTPELTDLFILSYGMELAG